MRRWSVLYNISILNPEASEMSIISVNPTTGERLPYLSPAFIKNHFECGVLRLQKSRTIQLDLPSQTPTLSLHFRHGLVAQTAWQNSKFPSGS